MTLIRNSASSSGLGDLFGTIKSAGGAVVRGAGDIITGVLSNPKGEKAVDALIDVYVAKSAAKIERDQSRERPEAAQAASSGTRGAPSSSSASVMGAPPLGGGGGFLSGANLPVAIGLGVVALVAVIFALRR